MRLIFIGRDSILQFGEELLSRLIKILGILIEQPTNPKFNHYLFDSIGALLKLTCSSQPQKTSIFEAALTPQFQQIQEKQIDGKKKKKISKKKFVKKSSLKSFFFHVYRCLKQNSYLTCFNYYLYYVHITQDQLYLLHI